MENQNGQMNPQQGYQQQAYQQPGYQQPGYQQPYQQMSPQPNYGTSHLGPQQQLPNAIGTLICGILSLLSGCVGAGLILGIVGVAISSKAERMYAMNPNGFTNGGMHKAGRIMSIIGLVLGGIAFIGGLISLIFLGGELFFLLDLMDSLL